MLVFRNFKGDQAPESWAGDDPCGSSWKGVECSSGKLQHCSELLLEVQKQSQCHQSASYQEIGPSILFEYLRLCFSSHGVFSTQMMLLELQNQSRRSLQSSVHAVCRGAHTQCGAARLAASTPTATGSLSRGDYAVPQVSKEYQ